MGARVTYTFGDKNPLTDCLTPQISQIHIFIVGGMHLATLDADLLNLSF
jgi:hypothetical protein